MDLWRIRLVATVYGLSFRRHAFVLSDPLTTFSTRHPTSSESFSFTLVTLGRFFYLGNPSH